MSKVSNVYDELRTNIEALLGSEYKQLPNPYAVIENPSLIATKAFGISFGGATNTNRLVGCKWSELREFTIVLVRRVSSLPTQASNLADEEKDILEDAKKLKQFAESNDYLNDNISGMAYLSDDGISYESTGRDWLLVTAVNIELEYLENFS